jgi:prepilin-type processing-associated H-X9-DG protein
MGYPNFGWGTHKTYPAYLSDGTSQTIVYTEKESQFCNGCAGWAPDAPENNYEDWGPSVNSAEGGQPTGLNSLFQTKPIQSQNDGNRASSPHTAGINVGMGDGSVRFVGQGVSAATWWSALTPNGGEVLGSDW